ncbi:unnamed protein product [Cunninghamella blakesleeana]
MYDPKETNDITDYNEIVPTIQSNQKQSKIRLDSKLNHHHHYMNKKLNYSIHEYSSYSAAYHPKYIVENKPLDQASRWSSAVRDQFQFLTISFPSPVVAKSITFGKFHRAHACNLKEFRVYGGYSQDNMLELLNSGLRNDNIPETFDLPIQRQQMIFPIQYLKIVPVSTFGNNFNFSIWFIEVFGINDNSTIEDLVAQYQKYHEIQATRLCLKHFRQRNMMHVFHMIKEGTGIELEHPLISDLHKELVIEGNFKNAEIILNQLYEQDIFDHYSKNAQYKADWRRIWATNQDGDAPSPRGGHQMCLDIDGRMIYLLGGWNGHQDLSDFWSYDIQKEQWKLLSNDTLKNGGPCPRSCHKISFDPKSRSIFVFGKYIESHSVSENHSEPDFYRYYCDHDKWIKISNNTLQEGGPGLIFDHQMSIDIENDLIYIFGGRSVSYDVTNYIYSGLYSYHIPSNTWKLLRVDNGGINYKHHQNHRPSDEFPSYNSNTKSRYIKSIKSRVGHSMLLDSSARKLYIFAGQRSKDYMSDFFSYSINDDDEDNDIINNINDQDQQIQVISHDYSKDNGPDVGYTQRATIDPDLKEIYVLSGYLKNQNSEVIKNGLWVYSINQRQWKNVYQNENRDPDYWNNLKHHEPCPRFAHQMIYDPISKTHFIFGGNPGDHEYSNKRLDDFWQLKLIKPNSNDILRRLIYKIRLQQLKERCISKTSSSSPLSPLSPYSSFNKTKDDNHLSALEYLRTYLTPLVNHDNQEELCEFKKLCTELCLSSENNFFSSPGKNCNDNNQDLFYQRKQVFDSLLEYIPTEMKEPVEQLLDVIKLV